MLPLPSSPLNLVDFGTGLFLNKTPSEESGSSSGGLLSGGSVGQAGPFDSPATTTESSSSSSFFPTNIISSVGASVGAMGASVGQSVGATVEAVGASVNAMGVTVGVVGYVCVCSLLDTYTALPHEREFVHDIRHTCHSIRFF